MESVDGNLEGGALSINRDQEEQTQNRELYRLVFEIELIREIIIDFVIHEGGQLSRATASSCRLVQRAWHDSVSKSLSNSGEPLFQFYLREAADAEPHSVVNQFLNAYASPSRAFPKAPPFALTVYLDYGLRIPVESSKAVLEKCLRWCSSGLVGLDCYFWGYDVKALELPDGHSLPVLHQLNLRFFDASDKRLGDDVWQVTGIQGMLSASKKLKCLTLGSIVGFPPPFSTLCLPV